MTSPPLFTAAVLSAGAATLSTIAGAGAAAPPVFEVKAAPFSARCDGRTDDTRAIQAAERAAARAGGTVVLPEGRCAISGPIAWDSHVSLQGAGMYKSTLVALPSFGFDPAHVRALYDGKFVGMIWLDGPTETSPLSDVRFADVGFDPRAGTQTYKLSGKGTFHCIAGYMRPLQRITFENLYFELGANTESYLFKSLGPKGFFGIELQTLGGDPQQPSHDLVFHNIVGTTVTARYRWRSRASTETASHRRPTTSTSTA